MPLFKSRQDAERDGDALYAPTSKEAIKAFVAAHGGHVTTDRIVDYMAEMYGLSETNVRMHLSELARGGDLEHPPIEQRRGAGPSGGGRGARGNSYTVPSDADDEAMCPEYM